MYLVRDSQVEYDHLKLFDRFGSAYMCEQIRVFVQVYIHVCT